MDEVDARRLILELVLLVLALLLRLLRDECDEMFSFCSTADAAAARFCELMVLRNDEGVGEPAERTDDRELEGEEALVDFWDIG